MLYKDSKCSTAASILRDIRPLIFLTPHVPPELNEQVDSTTRIGEYDEETQATIRKLMFDQRQKALGLPTSDELSADAILERAKALPGSPFLPGGALCSSAPVGVGPDGGERDLHA